jgi:hypothetical protein
MERDGMATTETKLVITPKHEAEIEPEIGTEIGGDAHDTQTNHTTP